MSLTRNVDFTKEFFIQSWPGGYYEHFSYGVGVDRVIQICVDPFIKEPVRILEIGSGGGTFTERLYKSNSGVTCIDVIPKPETLHCCLYIELGNQDYNCTGIKDNDYDFCFCYNVFCHLSNDAIRQYLKSVRRVLRPGGDFIFMLSSYGRGREDLGTLLDMGHFAQDERTLPLVIGEGWEIISPNMIPEHRDIIVHLKKIV